ncbi:MAG: ATP synthase F1 subunit epsilon [Planctomycetes bacterium]|nr:ATP synthase F1 subunit epsilon [Planctomycetota bacterium]
MSAPIRCTVVSPERPLFDGGAEKVVVPGTKGQIGIMPRHAALIAKLEPGVIRIHRPADEGGAVSKMAVTGGFVQVLHNVVTLLVTDAVVAEDVNAGALHAELEDVLAKLQHPASDDEYRSLLRRRRGLTAQLSLVE